MKLRTIISAIIVAAMLLLVGACSSSRNATSTAEQGQTNRPAKVAAKRFGFTSDLAATYADWTELHAPLSVEISEPINFSFSARATMVRGESIHLSMRVFGMEVAVAHVDNDSAWLVDKYHKYICSLPVRSLTGERFTLSDLQDLLLGHAFYPGKGTLTPTAETESLFSIQEHGDSILMMPRRIPTDAPWQILANPAPQIELFQVRLSETEGVQLSYQEYSATPAGQAAAEIYALGAFKRLKLNAKFTWNFGKAKWNENQSKPWIAPTDYKKIEVDALIEAFKN